MKDPLEARWFALALLPHAKRRSVRCPQRTSLSASEAADPLRQRTLQRFALGALGSRNIFRFARVDRRILAEESLHLSRQFRMPPTQRTRAFKKCFRHHGKKL